MKTIGKIALFSAISATFLVAGQAPKTYPDGEVGRMVKLGEDIINKTDTHPLTKDMVGNKLKCVNCHLQGTDGKPGTTDAIGTYIGSATIFPAYSKREKTVQTLQDRIANCFMRSMNGKRPIIDTKASLAMATYITWLSEGMPMKMNTKRTTNPTNIKLLSKYNDQLVAIQKKATHANYENGKKIFAAKCARCHGNNGQGMGTFPPLWGKDAKGNWLSYNSGAGMSSLVEAAAWIQSSMPFGQGGSLKIQEAADVTLFVNAQPRADFDLQKTLYPKAKMGYYNSKVLNQHRDVRSNFKKYGLDIEKIRGDKVIK